MRKNILFVAVLLACCQPLSRASVPPPIEPTTAIAVAQFSVSMLRSFSGGGNQLDAVVKLLTAINRKLDIMNDKLDIILEEVVKSPDRTVYKYQYEEAKSAMSRLSEYYAHYQRDVQDKGPTFAKLEFNKKYKAAFKDQLEKIKGTTFLLEHNDPLTVNFICLLATSYYEYSKFIDRDPDDLSYEMRPFYAYLIRTSWEGNNSLIGKIDYYRNAHQDLLDEDYKCRDEQKFHVGGGKEGSPDSWTEVRYYQTQKTLTREAYTPDETIALNYARVNGLYTQPLKGTYSYKAVEIDKKKYEQLSPDYKEARLKDLKQTAKYFAQTSNPKINEYHYTLVQYSATYLNAVRTIKFLKPIINEL